MATALVTGGSGFVGGHIVWQLLAAGHSVRATVRSEAKAASLRASLVAVGVPHLDRLDIFFADLARDDGWAEACVGCDFVLHVASPLAATKVEADVVGPAVDGSLRVLRAARDAGVKRVIVTSSCGAIYYGHPLQNAPFDETSYTRVDGGEMSAYVKSKALADQAVWSFMDQVGGEMELVSIYPTGIFGPAMGHDYASSLDLIRRLLTGAMPACPDLWFGCVDVRDVASLHLLAMTAPVAAGQRFIASSGPAVSMLDIAQVLRERLGSRANRVPTRKLPDLMVRIMSLFNDDLAALVPLLGKARSATSAKAKQLLGWKPRSWQDAVVAAAESLLDLEATEHLRKK